MCPGYPRHRNWLKWSVQLWSRHVLTDSQYFLKFHFSCPRLLCCLQNVQVSIVRFNVCDFDIFFHFLPWHFAWINRVWISTSELDCSIQVTDATVADTFELSIFTTGWPATLVYCFRKYFHRFVLKNIILYPNSGTGLSCTHLQGLFRLWWTVNLLLQLMKQWKPSSWKGPNAIYISSGIWLEWNIMSWFIIESP